MAIVASGLTPGAVRRDLIGECYSSTRHTRKERPPNNNNNNNNKKKKERERCLCRPREDTT